MSAYFYVFMVGAMVDHWTQIYIGEAYMFLWVFRGGIYALLPLATNSKKNIVGSRISIVHSTQQELLCSQQEPNLSRFQYVHQDNWELTIMYAYLSSLEKEHSFLQLCHFLPIYFQVDNQACIYTCLTFIHSF